MSASSTPPIPAKSKLSDVELQMLGLDDADNVITDPDMWQSAQQAALAAPSHDEDLAAYQAVDIEPVHDDSAYAVKVLIGLGIAGVLIASASLTLVTMLFVKSS